MEIKQMQFFKLTAELEHMTKAAEQLMVAQPFLSKTIAALEEELGVKLFDHVGRQIKLNDYGRAFYRRVERMLAELEDARRELGDMVDSRDKMVSVVTNTSLYMPGLLNEFRTVAPYIKLSQASARRFRILNMLKRGDVDFAICTPAIVDDPELETITLINEECPIIYPQDHWLSLRTEISLKELKNEAFISAIPGFGIRDLAENFFAAAKVHPEIIIESSDTSAVPNFVKKGLGIAFSPLSPVLQDPILLKNHIKLVDPPCFGVVGLTWKKERYQSKAGQLFRNLAQEYFARVDPIR